MLIDSGASKSFLDPKMAFKYFSKFIKEDPFIVSTIFQQSAHRYSANIPTSEIFNLSKEHKMKFHLFKFHDSFDGLLGMDNLKFLQAILDYEQGYLHTPYTSIKLNFTNPNLK